jgi:hypothetical protein
MPRPQFTIRALLVAMLVSAAFFGGVRFERERQRRADEAAALAFKTARMMLQGRATKPIKKDGFEFSFNSAEDRRFLFDHLPFLSE